MGAYNQPGAPSPTAIVVNFPAAGVYLYEVDYAEGGGPLVLTMTVSGATVAPAGALTLTPISVTPQSSGQSQTFTLTATDAGQTAVANLAVTLTITGVNPQQLNATTDANGHATFTYTGTHGGGTDTLQAQGTISGMLAYSNVLSVPWSGAANQAPAPNAGPPVTTTFSNPVTLNGSATDDGLPTGSTLAYTWTTVSGPGAVSFGTPNAAVTTASFSVVGTYTLQLSVSDSQLTGASTTTVTVNPAGSGPTLTLAPPAAGPRVTGSSQQLTATLKDATGTAVAGNPLPVLVTRSNAATG